MATSIQIIGKRAEVINDLDILALLGMLNKTAIEARGKYSSLQTVFERWRESCVHYGPGTLDLGLEEITANQTTKAELEYLLTDTERGLSRFGKTIPSSSLQSYCVIRGVKFCDYSTTNIRSTIERIRALMSGDPHR